MENVYKRAKQNRKTWFRGATRFLRLFFRKRKYLFLGEMPKEKCVVFSNHVGASCPVFHELYSPFKMRYWGTYEMTESFKVNYKYLSTTYLRDKKGFNKFFGKVIGGIITPFVRIFYRGMQLIPTYKNINFFKTIKMSEKSINDGETLIIYPEDSHDGYHDHLTNYFSGGFYFMDKYTTKYNCDLTVFNCYYVKKLRTFIVDKEIMFSELKNEFGTDYDAMAKKFCDRANELGEHYRKINNIKTKK